MVYIKLASLFIIGVLRRKKEKEDWKCIGKNGGWKLPKAKEGNIYPDIGSTEVSNRPIPWHIIIKMAKAKDKRGF